MKSGDKEALFGAGLAVFGLEMMGAPARVSVGLPSFAAGIFLLYRGVRSK